MASSKNFTSDELKCSCCGEEQIQQWALDKLQVIREEVDRPLAITSAYRCANHPAEKRKVKPGTHNQGIAFDVAVNNGAERHQIIGQGLLHGATGIGIAKTFVHLDFRDGVAVSWVY